MQGWGEAWTDGLVKLSRVETQIFPYPNLRMSLIYCADMCSTYEADAVMWLT